MGDAPRKPTVFFRRSSPPVPDALRGGDHQAAVRAARLSIAVGTALALVTGSGAVRADVESGRREAAGTLIGSPAAGSTASATLALRPGGSALHAADVRSAGLSGAARATQAGHGTQVGRTAQVAHLAQVGPVARTPVGSVVQRAVDPGAHPADPQRGAGAAVTAAGSTNAAMARAEQHTAPAKASDPVATRLNHASAAAEAVAERLTEAQATLDVLVAGRNAAAADLLVAQTAAAEARTAAAIWTRESFIEQSSRPPGLVTDPRTGMLGRPEIGTAVLDLETAEAREHTAADAADRALATMTAQLAHVATLRRDLAAYGDELRRLRAARASAVADLERRRDHVEAALAHKYLRDGDGAAGESALRAVAFALAQRGKPYEWGAEGPDRFDCSGLVQTAYATADVALPRTARPQYRATTPVSVTALLPGDLLFFATDHADWNTIHHVGVYLGRGLMVHAPTTGDVVRVAPVWWSEFFAAGRVVPGHPGRRADSSLTAGLRPDLPAHRAPSVTPSPSASSSASPSVPADPATATPPSGSPKPTTPSPTTTPGIPSATESRTATPGRATHGAGITGGPTEAPDGAATGDRPTAGSRETAGATKSTGTRAGARATTAAGSSASAGARAADRSRAADGTRASDGATAPARSRIRSLAPTEPTDPDAPAQPDDPQAPESPR